MYFNDFISANQFTQSIGLPGAAINPATNVPYLNNPAFINRLAPLVKIDHPAELVAQCNVVSQVMCDAIKKLYGCDAYLTIGDVSFHGKPYFNVDQQSISTAIRGGKQSLHPQNYKHHAWITLDSMEIIDFTMSTSLAVLNKKLSKEERMKMLGGVLSGHADQLTGGMQYHPVLIGEQFYEEYDATYAFANQTYINRLAGK